MTTETTERPILAKKHNIWCGTCGRGATVWAAPDTNMKQPWDCTICRKWWEDNPPPPPPGDPIMTTEWFTHASDINLPPGEFSDTIEYGGLTFNRKEIHTNEDHDVIFVIYTNNDEDLILELCND